MNNKEAFLREVSFLKQLRSEFVVDLIDYYEDSEGKNHCVVLEYGEKSLADFLKRGPLQRNERKFIVDRLANVALHLHSQNVVHCDLKPQNFVLFGLKWKVIDLENARSARARRLTRLTRARPAGHALACFSHARSARCHADWPSRRLSIGPARWQAGGRAGLDARLSELLLARARTRRAEQVDRPDARRVRHRHVGLWSDHLRALRPPALFLGQAGHDAAGA